MLIAEGLYPCLRLLQHNCTTQSDRFGQVAIAVVVTPNLARAVEHSHAAYPEPEQIETWQM